MERKTPPLLQVRNLSVGFGRYGRGFRKSSLAGVRDLSFTLNGGELLAVVGASGSGKSLLAHRVLGILPANAAVGGQVFYEGRPLDAALAKEPGEYMKLAKEFAEKKNLVGGAVKECVYNCQGYSSNDPTITIDVYGVSGERASITFSRYDRAVLGISLDANEKIMEMMQKLWEQNAAEMDNNMAGGITGNAEEITELKAK